MKIFLFLICLCIFIFSCQKQIDITEFNKELIQIVKENSLYSDSLNWSLIEKEIDSVSKVKQNLNQCSTSVAYLINKLEIFGDNHTRLISKKSFKEMGEQNLCTEYPESKYLGNNIAYIKVPGIMTANISIMNTYATKTQQLIKTLDTNFINGWIVDLRGNTGGSLYPMIAGLGPLLGEGNLGYSINKNGKKRFWSYQKGTVIDIVSNNFFIKNGKKIKQVNKITKTVSVSIPYYINNKNPKIAILINNRTSSAGEFAAISFIGKSNTKLFGQVSGGYTTDNDAFLLSDGSLLNLATSVTADRDMKIYNNGIVPDVLIYDYMYNDDRCVNEAIKWLRESN